MMTNNDICTKLKYRFHAWLNGEDIPNYLKIGRIFVLSKEDSQFPQVGNIRTISILRALTKLYELTLLQHLEIEISRLNLIPEK